MSASEMSKHPDSHSRHAPESIRVYEAEDESALNEVAKLAFSEYSPHFANWQSYISGWSRMSELADDGVLLIAEIAGEIVGGVCYIGPGRPRQSWIDTETALIRSLVVKPAHRGKGIGRRLTERCIEMAKKDKCPTVTCQSSPVMADAVSLYCGMGFKLAKTLGTQDAVTWNLYCLNMSDYGQE